MLPTWTWFDTGVLSIIVVVVISVIGLSAIAIGKQANEPKADTVIRTNCEFYESGEFGQPGFAVFAKCAQGGAILYTGDKK